MLWHSYSVPPSGEHIAWNDIAGTINDANKRKSEEIRVAVFQKICDTWKPVMRHYFTEKHKMPITWFRMRLNYARTLATSSIVGHILGLGDRHLSNILIHEQSGEIVPIDLGIAFDQVSIHKLDWRTVNNGKLPRENFCQFRNVYPSG